MIMKKAAIAIVIVAIILGVLYWEFGPSFNKPKPVVQEQVTLNYWGLWEGQDDIRPAINAFQQLHPNIKVNYTRNSSINYRSRVQTQLRNGQGPDVFRLHASWVPMFVNDLYPAPSTILTQQDFDNTFYPIAKTLLTGGGKIYAVPMEIDGLVMFVNEDILKGANVTVPTNWQDFLAAANKMTVKDATGKIQTSGAALGATGNVDHWPDIIGLLFSQQPNGNLAQPANKDGADVLKFYTGFVTDKNNKTWDVSLPSSTQMFIEGRLAFYFAPSWRAHDLREANPNLKFKTVPVPQLPGGRNVAWASFWAEGVSAKSAHPNESWEFAKFLIQADTLKNLYRAQSTSRLFGEPYSRVDISQELLGDTLIGSVIQQAPYYKGWYLNSRTFDAGINDEMIKYYEDAVNQVQQGIGAEESLTITAKGVQQVLEKFTKGAPDINK